jgi:hypothetical protein
MLNLNNSNQPRLHSEIEGFLQKHSQTAFERYLEVSALRKKHPKLTLQQAFNHIYPKDGNAFQYLAAIKMINTRLEAGDTLENLQKLYPPELEQTKISAVVEEQRSQTATKVRGIRPGQPSPTIEIISGNIEEAEQAQQIDNDDYDKANDEFIENINRHN